MCLNLVIADTRSDLLATWSEAFNGIKSVSFLNASPASLRSLPNLDAMMFPWTMAHERYGGTQQAGEAQIISTLGEQGVPPWVITTVPFHADAARALSIEDRAYTTFAKVCQLIKEFNETDAEPKIATLGVDLYILGYPEGEPREEAEAVRRAYVNYCCRSS